MLSLINRHHSHPTSTLLPLRIGLLLQLTLHTPLQRLSLIVLIRTSGLLFPIASQTSNGTADSSGHAVGNARSQVVELSGCFLGFTLFILLLAFLLQAFKSQSSADEFFARSDCLVPAALLAVGVVGGDTRCRD